MRRTEPDRPERSALARRVEGEIGRVFPAHAAPVTPEHVAAFARAITDADPIYQDADAARLAGHPAVPAPPTYLFALSIAKPRPFDVYEDLGIAQTDILHAEQSFRFHAPIHVGQILTFTPRLTQAGEKRGGALLFTTVITDVTDAQGMRVAELGTVVAVRQQEAPERRSGPPAAAVGAANGAANGVAVHDVPTPMLPAIVMPPVARAALAAYAEASGDRNPIHLDRAAARAAGLDDVIAHGMLIAAYAAGAIGRWFPQRPIARLDTRFTRMTRPGDMISLTLLADDSEPGRSAYAIEARDQTGELKLRTQVAFAD